jgi:hypothetical protein
MKTQFKILFVLLITMQIVLGQNVNVFSKSFKTDKNTTAYIEIPDGSVKFVASPDDSIHIEYDVNFIKLPKKEHKGILENTRVEATKENNYIIIKKHPNIKIPSDLSHITVFSLDKLIYTKKDTTENATRKLKADVLNEITEIKSYKSFHEAKAKIIYANDLKRKERLLKKAAKWQENRNFERNFIIKVPKHISLKIVAKGSLLNFYDEFDNQLSIRLDYGRLYINRIKNPKNELKINNSLLVARNISGGKLETDRVFKALIAELNNVDIESEFSKIEIGEIAKDVTITDFNSKFYLYNFSNDFETLNINSEYSEINLFLPKDMSYQLTTFGNYTKHFVDNELVDFPIDKNKTNTKMLDLNQKGNDNNLNAIKINTINGIIRIAKDVIELGQ